jgi:hypothetical protein
MRWLLLAVMLSVAFPVSAFAIAPLPNPCSLLTSKQVAPAVDGTAQTHSETGDPFGPTCTWTGPPMGYMQTRTPFMLQIFRLSKARFSAAYQRVQTGTSPVPGLGDVAYSGQGSLAVWKDGLALQLFGAYLSVYPARGITLARDALKAL